MKSIKLAILSVLFIGNLSAILGTQRSFTITNNSEKTVYYALYSMDKLGGFGTTKFKGGSLDSLDSVDITYRIKDPNYPLLIVSQKDDLGYTADALTGRASGGEQDRIYLLSDDRQTEYSSIAVSSYYDRGNHKIKLSR